jgi:hypothetical protein
MSIIVKTVPAALQLPGNRLREDLHARPITGIGRGGMY